METSLALIETPCAENYTDVEEVRREKSAVKSLKRRRPSSATSSGDTAEAELLRAPRRRPMLVLEPPPSLLELPPLEFPLLELCSATEDEQENCPILGGRSHKLSVDSTESDEEEVSLAGPSAKPLCSDPAASLSLLSPAWTLLASSSLRKKGCGESELDRSCLLYTSDAADE
eukprot:TRINITY_DN1810_c0_g1_i15.p2 TRINITY_DN1810_c0_g1~~TRINITY_DN1810_c0_g1_i15.p2  ORF type:complete len:173 (-),score=40.87 TRINITY_DN1810_c0_g1_i15:28-546(-)